MLERLYRQFGGFRFQLVALIAMTGLTLFVALQVVDTSTEMKRERSEKLNDALAITSIAARSLEGGFAKGDLDEMRNVLAAVRSHKDVVGASLVDRELNFQIDNRGTTFAPLPVTMQSQMQMKSLRSGQTEHQFGGKGVEVATPLVSGDRVVGSVAVWSRNPSVVNTALSVMLPNLTAILPVLAAAGLLSLALANRVSQPLTKLRKAVMKFADGDLDQKVDVGGFKEVRLLGESLQRLIGKVRNDIERIYELAYVDRITQLPNREFFKGEVIRAIKRAERVGSSGAVLFVDLDGFKRVNDTLGHGVGDRLLRQFSERVAKIIRANDAIAWEHGKEFEPREAGSDKQVFARLGGDEFTVLLEEIREETDAASVARRIIAATGELFIVDGTEVSLGASIGIATYPRDGSDYHSILKSADMAMYQAKEEGKNTYRFYSDELNQHAARRLEVESDLRRALAREELELYFQPIVDARSGEIVSAEALVRWSHPVKGMIDPGEFIKVAEKSGLVFPLGSWVLKAACERVHEFNEAGFDVPVAVNVSPTQFEQADFAQKVLDAIQSCRIKAEHLQLEISEEALMVDQRRTLEHFRRLKRAGVRIAVDDFGTGQSNLSYLGRMRLDIVKIDRSFVESLQESGDDWGRRTIGAVLALAKSLEYETVAVGVETEAQLKFLRDGGCDRVQGYLIGQPMPVGEFLNWLTSRHTESDGAESFYREASAG